MIRLFITAALIALLVSNAAVAKAPARRVVSLDYCADQFVLKLLPRSRILAVSPDAEKHFSYMRDSAVGIRSVRPLAEDVLTLEPDLVVRSYGGGPNAARFFERAGISVLQIPYANDLDGIRNTVKFLADSLDVARCRDHCEIRPSATENCRVSGRPVSPLHDADRRNQRARNTRS